MSSSSSPKISKSVFCGGGFIFHSSKSAYDCADAKARGLDYNAAISNEYIGPCPVQSEDCKGLCWHPGLNFKQAMQERME